MINEEAIKGKWKEIKGEVRNQWGKMTEMELDKISGNLTKRKEDVQAKLQAIAGKLVKETGDLKNKIKKNINNYK